MTLLKRYFWRSVLLPSLAVKHQSASFVFTTFITESYGFVRNIG